MKKVYIICLLIIAFQAMLFATEKSGKVKQVHVLPDNICVLLGDAGSTLNDEWFAFEKTSGKEKLAVVLAAAAQGNTIAYSWSIQRWMPWPDPTSSSIGFNQADRVYMVVP